MYSITDTISQVSGEIVYESGHFKAPTTNNTDGKLHWVHSYVTQVQAGIPLVHRIIGGVTVRVKVG